MNEGPVARWQVNTGRRLTRRNFVVSYAPLPSRHTSKRLRDRALDRLLGLL